MSRDPSHILIGVTSSVSIAFFKGQLRDLQRRGWRCTVVASPDVPGQLESFSVTEGVPVIPLQMDREIHLKQDVAALWHALRILVRTRPAITNVGTPKAGLILGLAAALTRVPFRVYTLHGLRLETVRGAKGSLLRLTERISMAAAHSVVCVSPSLRDRVLELGLTKPSKVTVNGLGSINGVAIPDTSPRPQGGKGEVIGFVGRLTRDKGVQHLVEAFHLIAEEFPQARLLLIGAPDTADPLPGHTLEEIRSDERIEAVGQVKDVSPYYRQMSVLLLPSFREGLPTVLLEAAAHALPVITCDVTGARDGVVHGQTGWLVPAHNSRALADALLSCLDNPEDSQERGRTGREWVSINYSREVVWQGWHEFYLDARNLGVRAADSHIMASRTP